MDIIKLLFFAFATIILFSFSAHAEDQKNNSGWLVTIGTGGVYAPAFLGSKNYQL